MNLDKLREASESPMEEFASSILELLQMVVPFHTGVIYFSDPDGRSTNMVVAATKDENPKCLLRSYWPDAAKGLTYEAMLHKQPFSGGPDDLPREARRTNDEALKHVPGALHAAWGLVPFVDENKGVAVAHIEGIRGGLGLARYEWEALNLLGKPVGEIIASWNKKTEKIRALRPEVDLVEQMHELLHYVRPERSSKEQFQALVCRIFMGPPGIEDITWGVPFC